MEGRALSPDMLCRDSEEPACRGGVLPDAGTGQGPGTLAPPAGGSRCSILIAGRCAYPGARTITKLSWEQEQKQKV